MGHRDLIAALMAHEWGAVNEVLPKAALVDRAREIAWYLLRFSPLDRAWDDPDLWTKG